MSDVVPMLSRDPQVSAVAQALRDMAERVERGEISHVMAVAQTTQGKLRSVSHYDRGVPVHGLLGAVEVAKAVLLVRALEDRRELVVADPVDTR